MPFPSDTWGFYEAITPFFQKNVVDILLVANVLERKNVIYGRKPFLFLNINAVHALQVSLWCTDWFK